MVPGQEFNKGRHPDHDIKVELIVNDRAEAMVLHDKPFFKELAWLEFNLDDHKLEFIMDDGDIRNFGIPIDPDLSKYLQNSFQVLMVEMNEETGEPTEGAYLPLIIHRI